MSHTPHELAEDFPELSDTIAQLRQHDRHFEHLANSYHSLNRAIHRAETNVEPTSDDHVIDMRKKRVALKDEIYTYVKSRAAG